MSKVCPFTTVWLWLNDPAVGKATANGPHEPGVRGLPWWNWWLSLLSSLC